MASLRMSPCDSACRTPSIDAKPTRRNPAAWQALTATTLIVTFIVIAQGRNRFVAREIGWISVIGVIAWAAVLYFVQYRQLTREERAGTLPAPPWTGPMS